MLIVFEGGEGSGKGTQIKLLQSYLEQQNRQVLSIVEPGGTSVGKLIREILLEKQNLGLFGITEAFLFSASRAQEVLEVVKPALAKGTIVLSDRSFYSTYAYQGYARGLSMPTLEALTKIAIDEVKPDLVILLDIPPEKGILRKKAQDEVNRLDLEGLEFHKKVRQGYLQMANNDPALWKVIDATDSIENVFDQVKKAVMTLISN